MYSGKTKEDFYYELEKIGISNLYVNIHNGALGICGKSKCRKCLFNGKGKHCLRKDLVYSWLYMQSCSDNDLLEMLESSIINSTEMVIKNVPNLVHNEDFNVLSAEQKFIAWMLGYSDKKDNLNFLIKYSVPIVLRTSSKEKQAQDEH